MVGIVHGKLDTYSLDHLGNGNTVFRWYNLDQLDSLYVEDGGHSHNLYNPDRGDSDHSGNELVHIVFRSKYGMFDTIEHHHRCNHRQYHSNTMVYSTSGYRRVYSLPHIRNAVLYRHFFWDILCDQYLNKSEREII